MITTTNAERNSLKYRQRSSGNSWQQRAADIRLECYAAMEQARWELRHWQLEFAALEKVVARFVIKPIRSVHYHDEPFAELEEAYRRGFAQVKQMLNSLQTQLNTSTDPTEDMESWQTAARQLQAAVQRYDRQLKQQRLELYRRLHPHLPVSIF
ncbi:MAG: hypothetical protein AAFO94_17310 [Bacteroidota bacterium]